MDDIRILIVDDHEVVRTGLRMVFDNAGDMNVVGEASTAAEALAQTSALRPDVVLMDVCLGPEGDQGGIEACRTVRSDLPEIQVLMFSSYGERETVLAAILAGASGYITKDVGRSRLLDGLRATAAGQSQLDPMVTEPVLERLRDLSAREQPPEDSLSPREREVLSLIAQGMSNREIAERLVISEHTARNHVTGILNKLGFSRRVQAAAYAARRGLLSEDE